MSDQDKPRPKPGAPLSTVIVGSNQAREDSGLGPLPTKPSSIAAGTAAEQKPPGIAAGTGESRRTLGGVTVPSKNSDVTVVLPAAPPAPPKSTANGTPPQTPVIAPPSAATLHANPRARRSSEAPSALKSSAWDTFEGGSTGVHATSAAPHPGVRINQYEMIK